MTTLTIEHTAAGGTVLRDTAKGDGAAEARRAAGGAGRATLGGPEPGTSRTRETEHRA